MPSNLVIIFILLAWLASPLDWIQEPATFGSELAGEADRNSSKRLYRPSMLRALSTHSS